jgi:hypothetical protein
MAMTSGTPILDIGQYLDHILGIGIAIDPRRPLRLDTGDMAKRLSRWLSLRTGWLLFWAEWVLVMVVSDAFSRTLYGENGGQCRMSGRASDASARASGAGLPMSGAFTTTTVRVKIFTGIPSVPTTGG